MEMISGAAIFAALNMICELIIIALVPPRWKLRVLGNDRAMIAVHMGMGLITARLHWGTVTGSGAAMMAFVISFPTLWIAKQVFFGYIRPEPHTVTNRNYEDYRQHLTEQQLIDFHNGIGLETTVMVPIFHRRIIGYTALELK